MTDELTREYSQIKSLLLNLPHGDVGYFGALLSNFCIHCEKALEDGADPITLVEHFVATLEHTETTPKPEERVLLARFVQFLEREVALLDALEESSVISRFDRKRNPDFEAMVAWIKREGLQEALGQAVADFSLRIVLTAHPTEFYPTVIQRLMRELASALARDDSEQVDMLILQLSKTSFRHRKRISPVDEAERLIGYLRDVFFQAIPIIEAQLRDYLRQAVTPGAKPIKPPAHPLVVMGFWPGGDRDGNPRITTEVTLSILERLRQSVLECYAKAFTDLSERMTFVGLFSHQERILARLRNSAASTFAAPASDAYDRPEDLRDDLLALRQEISDSHQGVFADLFTPLLTALDCFGFHFASMDLRQDSLSHRALLGLVGEQLGLDGIDSQGIDSQALAKLVSALGQGEIDVDLAPLLAALKSRDSGDDQVLYETALLMSRIPDIHRFNGVASMHRYIISNTTSKDDCLILLALLRILAGASSRSIDIVPLFESIDDLEGSAATMEALFTDPDYKGHIDGLGRQVTIMLGFSDGTKDGGYLAGSGRILFVKQELSSLGDKHGIRTIFFDGRGGPPGRGGGSVTDYYASMGPLVQSRQIQLTIQGQTVSSSFSTIPSAVGTISGYAATGLENRVLKSTGRLRRLSAADRELLGQLIADSHAHYRSLIERDDFIDFLTEITPFRYFALANHSSRPSRRKGAISLGNIRAISYVASWSQMKLGIPGYFGFGHALGRAIEREGIERMRQLFEQSRFFKALVSDSLDVLNHTDDRFTCYVAQDSRFAGIYALLREETARAREALGQIHERDFNASARLREELMLPAVWLQQYCMRRLAQSGEAASPQSSEKAKFLSDMVVKLMAIIINAGRNSA